MALAFGAACVTAAPATARPNPTDVQSIVDDYVASGVPGAMVYARTRRTQWTVSGGTAEIGVDDPIRPRDRVRVATSGMADYVMDVLADPACAGPATPRPATRRSGGRTRTATSLFPASR